MDPTLDESICRHFINGYCRFGSGCFYRHELRSSSSLICRYFQKGICWYGDRCRYKHVLLSEVEGSVTGRRGSVPAVSSRVAHGSSERRGSEPALLRNHATSTLACNRSESAFNTSNFQPNVGRLADGIVEEQSLETDLDDVHKVAQASARHGKKGETSSSELHNDGAAAAAANSGSKSEVEEMEAVLLSKNVTCGICMEKIYDKPKERDRVFGILPGCKHSFCLSCISTWRKTKDLGRGVVRSCPLCRVRSAFYVPNKHWVEGPAKEKIIDEFKKKASKKRCIFYERDGHCPFKRDCLYQHVKRSNRHAFSYFSDDEDDELDLFTLFISMTLLASDDSDDEDFRFHLFEDIDV